MAWGLGRRCRLLRWVCRRGRSYISPWGVSEEGELAVVWGRMEEGYGPSLGDDNVVYWSMFFAEAGETNSDDHC